MMWPLLSLALFASCALAIWPLPVSYSNGTEVLWIDRNVKISYNGGSSVSEPKVNHNPNKLIRATNHSFQIILGPARSLIMQSNEPTTLSSTRTLYPGSFTLGTRTFNQI